MTPIPHPQDRRLYALGLRLLAVSGFSLMMVLIKLASMQGVGVAEIVFWRQALALPVILLVIARGPGLASVRTTRFGAHFVRSAVGLTCMAVNFGSIVLLPLAEATTIGFAAPIFATILSFLVFGEKVGIRRGLAVMAGFIGVVIVAQPSGGNIDPLGAALGLTAALIVAWLSFQIRDLGRTELATTTSFWFAFLSTMGLLTILPFVWMPHEPVIWLLLLGIGTVGGLSQLAMTNSLRYAPVSTVVGMDYVSLVWSALAGWLLWNDVPTARTWLGAAIIIGSGLYIAWREHRLSLDRNREIAA